MTIKKKGQIGPRYFVYFVGLLIMALGIVLLIKADLGATPWDVLHVGFYYQVGLTIGSWSIICGFVILTIAAILSKEFPQLGAFLNMILVGLFIDFYLLIPILQTPDHLFGKLVMFVFGLLLMGYGMGFYLSAQLGAGPRDSLMIAVTSKTGWKVRNVRAGMEVIVLFIGWQLGGPVFWGTILFSLTIGPIVGAALPQCQDFTDEWLKKLGKSKQVILEESKRGASL
ncbi:YitT family protein [Cytobacillus sp. FJAT-54145]|uniref:YitT family protein n=1 Tax=Cytobacillus spartinae TaxID=3299023 RepID=A0ABW6KK77_9BACI